MHVDVALRIDTLPDSKLVATPVGEVRRVVCVLDELEQPALAGETGFPGQGRLPMKTRAFIDFAAGSIRERIWGQASPASGAL